MMNNLQKVNFRIGISLLEHQLSLRICQNIINEGETHFTLC